MFVRSLRYCCAPSIISTPSAPISTPSVPPPRRCAVLSAKGRAYPVETFYLEDVLQVMRRPLAHRAIDATR